MEMEMLIIFMLGGATSLLVVCLVLLVRSRFIWNYTPSKRNRRSTYLPPAKHGR